MGEKIRPATTFLQHIRDIHSKTCNVRLSTRIKNLRRTKTEERIHYTKVAPGAYHAMLGLEKYIHESGLEEGLLHLIKLRASQINGCAYCLDMHWKDLRSIGENEQRLYSLDAWEESPFYTERERAALAWTEAVTRVSETHVPDEVYEKAKKQFSEKELADLTLAVATINAWNRLAIAARTTPGTYQPVKRNYEKERRENRDRRDQVRDNSGGLTVSVSSSRAARGPGHPYFSR